MTGTIKGGEFARFWRGLDVQRCVIGALILRELHTRYGRENIGYLWMLAEPMLLAGVVSMIHIGEKTHYASDIRPVPFAIGGYCVFILFRSIITRAESAIESNRPLLYHRMVTIFDMLAARALLEGAATFATFTLLILIAAGLGLGDLPARPIELGCAVILMLWFSLALSMLICAATYDNKLVSKFIHPITYLLMPMSGAFFQLEWIPEPYRGWLSWFPMTQIFELVRYGQFRSATLDYVDIPYIVGWNLVLTYMGLIVLKVVRRHVHI